MKEKGIVGRASPSPPGICKDNKIVKQNAFRRCDAGASPAAALSTLDLHQRGRLRCLQNVMVSCKYGNVLFLVAKKRTKRRRFKGGAAKKRPP